MDLMPFKTSFPRWGRSVNEDITSLQREMSDVLDNFFGRSNIRTPKFYDMSFYPAVDIQEKADKYLLEAELPGMKVDEVELDLHNNILTITGEKKSVIDKKKDDYAYSERYFGSFRRDITFEDEVDPENIKADLKNGILNVQLMKKEKGKKTHRKIEIKH